MFHVITNKKCINPLKAAESTTSVIQMINRHVASISLTDLTQILFPIWAFHCGGERFGVFRRMLWNLSCFGVTFCVGWPGVWRQRACVCTVYIKNTKSRRACHLHTPSWMWTKKNNNNKKNTRWSTWNLRQYPQKNRIFEGLFLLWDGSVIQIQNRIICQEAKPVNVCTT